jgi:hypothetical protein
MEEKKIEKCFLAFFVYDRIFLSADNKLTERQT